MTAARTMSFHAPTSLAGTLAGYAARKSSVDSTLGKKASVVHDEEMDTSNGIYSRTLPSLHFLRWRPLYHMLAPNGWMNDPCAPGHDPTTGLYHVSFQWNPRRNKYGKISWGEISWGHATSKDLVNWNISGAPIIKPQAWYDKVGCFTGCMYPTGVDGQSGKLTLFYTGVGSLPLHYTLPYTRGCESQNIVESSDGGQTWIRRKGNPFMPEPPPGISVSGFRDPHVAPWPPLDRLLGQKEGENLYGVISGGIKGKTPTAFLFAVNRNDLSQWMYLSSLVDLGLNHIISRWSGDMGINWECANFSTQTDNEGTSREFIVVGGEGSKTSSDESTFKEYPQQQTEFPRTARSLQWMCGSLRNGEGPDGKTGPKMEYEYGGRFDNGCLYGVMSFLDPNTKKTIAWGWITEEDLPQKLVDRQNWSGCLSLPRELGLQTLHNVKGALVSPLEDLTCFETQQESESTFTVRTLSQIPARHTEALRTGSRELAIQGPQVLLDNRECAMDVQTCRFELGALLSISDQCSRIGLSVFHTQDHDPEQSTQIYLTPRAETIYVERPSSTNVDANIHTFTEVAPFTLFTFASPDRDVREKLEIRAWMDESVLEIFVNGRTAITTRIYPATKRCWGIRFWAEDRSQSSSLIEARCWDGLRSDIRVGS